MIQLNKYNDYIEATRNLMSAERKVIRAADLARFRSSRRFNHNRFEILDKPILDLVAIQEEHIRYHQHNRQEKKSLFVLDVRKRRKNAAEETLETIRPQWVYKKEVTFKFPVNIGNVLKDRYNYYDWILDNIFIWSLGHCNGAFQITSPNANQHNDRDVSLVFELAEDRALFTLTWL